MGTNSDEPRDRQRPAWPSGPHPTPRPSSSSAASTRQLRLFEPALVRMATAAVVRHARPGGHGPQPGHVPGRGRHRPDGDRHRSSRSSHGAATGLIVYQAALAVLLLLTVLFANFASALAEARGKAQADSLRQTRARHAGLPPRRPSGRPDGEVVSSTQLRAGDLRRGRGRAGHPRRRRGGRRGRLGRRVGDHRRDAPVVREAGGDRSGVTGGTRVLSDRIVVRVTAEPGQSFLDRMIALVEGAIAPEDAQRDRPDDRPGRLLAHLPDRHRDALPDGPLLRPARWTSRRWSPCSSA